jgi:hypothetical protein
MGTRKSAPAVSAAAGPQGCYFWAYDPGSGAARIGPIEASDRITNAAEQWA